MNIKERQRIVLAALIHDVGKFWERADVKWDISENIKKHFPNREFAHIVPKYENGNPKYTHALWTHLFISELKVGQHLALDGEGDKTLANLSAKHHLPDNQLNFSERIISLADKWSSSIDRPDEGEEDESHYDQVKKIWGSGFSNKVPLDSIFNAISIDGKINDGKSKINFAKLSVLDPDNIYAIEYIANQNDSLRKEYAKHWQEFRDEISKLERCKTFDSYFVTLNDIMRNYMWCIPSATNTIPSNVSLYEHSKTTAGIALALYDYCISEGKDNIEKDDQSLMMLCIDIAGIQKFIYDIANKKAAKSLKGRSFYLQLLMDNIIDRLLSHNDVMAYRTNVIYASGGKAYIILPNIIRVHKAIEKVDLDIQEYLWKEHQGKLFAVFGKITFSYHTSYDKNKKIFSSVITSNEILDEELVKLKIKDRSNLDLGHIWRLASDRAALGKNRKFKSKIIKEFKSFFEPIAFDPNEEKCYVSGERGKLVLLDDKERDEDKQIWVLPAINDQSKLGEDLKDANFIVTYTSSDDKLRSNITIDNYKYSTYYQENLKYLAKGDTYDTAVVSVLNRTDFDEKLDNAAIRTLFYGGNKQPLINGKKVVKTYEDLAIFADKPTKLAILRMDVDNLGQIFINGFDEKVNGQKKSFGAYSTLSFMLEAFFCGHINYIHQRCDREFKDYVQILYSGGDDLFAVGRWDRIIDFAEEIRLAFKRFVGREDITISGGIAIVGAKYPIMKSAEIAGDMEKKAKAFNNNAKNAINFFGETVSWDREFDFVKEIKNELVDKGVNSAFLHKMQDFKLMKDKFLSKSLKTPSYKWNAAYYTSKVIEKTKDSDIRSLIEKIQIGVFSGDSDFASERYLDLLGLACRWAEYQNKLKLINNVNIVE